MEFKLLTCTFSTNLKLNYFFSFVVFNPTIAYSGQKLMKLVSANTPPRISKMIPNVPEITCVKNKIAMTMATIILTILSVDPMFDFI